MLPAFLVHDTISLAYEEKIKYDVNIYLYDYAEARS